jgi:hypothetical protein
MFKTVIEYLDGKVKEYPTRHLARTLDNTYRLTFKHDEIDIPLCNIRTIRTILIDEQGKEQDPIIDGDQKWEFTNPLKRKPEIKLVDR